MIALVIAGPVILVVVAIAVVRALARRPIPNPRRCPHGFTDWDDCPDCCH